MARKYPLAPLEIQVCRRFRDARMRSRLTQKAIAEFLGLTRGQVAQLEVGNIALRFRAGWAFCEHLLINPAWLADGADWTRQAEVGFFETYRPPFEFGPIEDLLFTDGVWQFVDLIETVHDTQEERDDATSRFSHGRLPKSFDTATPVIGERSHGLILRDIAEAWFKGLNNADSRALLTQLAMTAQAFRERRLSLRIGVKGPPS